MKSCNGILPIQGILPRVFPVFTLIYASCCDPVVPLLLPTLFGKSGIYYWTGAIYKRVICNNTKSLVNITTLTSSMSLTYLLRLAL